MHGFKLLLKAAREKKPSHKREKETREQEEERFLYLKHKPSVYMAELSDVHIYIKQLFSTYIIACVCVLKLTGCQVMISFKIQVYKPCKISEFISI